MIIGRVDKIADKTLFGWAFDQDSPNEHVAIEVLINGALVTTGHANKLRPDLKDGGLGGGDHAFEIGLPIDAPPHHISVRAVTSKGSSLLEFAEAGEKQFAELYDIITKRYDALFAKMLVRVESSERHAKAIKLDDLSERCSQLESQLKQMDLRLEGMEVFLVRFDEIARRFVEAEKRRSRKRFFGIF